MACDTRSSCTLATCRLFSIEECSHKILLVTLSCTPTSQSVAIYRRSSVVKPRTDFDFFSYYSLHFVTIWISVGPKRWEIITLLLPESKQLEERSARPHVVACMAKGIDRQTHSLLRVCNSFVVVFANVWCVLYCWGVSGRLSVNQVSGHGRYAGPIHCFTLQIDHVCSQTMAVRGAGAVSASWGTGTRTSPGMSLHLERENSRTRLVTTGMHSFLLPLTPFVLLRIQRIVAHG